MFCSNCGQEVSGNFCSNCGAPLSKNMASTAPPQEPQELNNSMFEEKLLLECQPAGLIDKAKSQVNANATIYRITNQRVIIESGLLGKKQDEVELNKIKDFSVKQSMTEKLMGIGTIEIISIDPSTPKVKLENVEKPFEVKDLIRAAMLEYKKQMNISYRENL